jgi:hypothetical protein
MSRGIKIFDLNSSNLVIVVPKLAYVGDIRINYRIYFKYHEY